MEHLEIINNDNAIATFMPDMRWYIPANTKYEPYWKRDHPVYGSDGSIPFKPDKLYYRSSWRWLMGVIEKIESITIESLSVGGDYQNHCIRSLKLIRGCIPTIEVTYQAVVDFVNWYNEQSI